MQAESSMIWEELDMDSVSVELARLFPDIRFDGKEILSLLLQGQVWQAVKVLGSEITDVINSQIGEFRTLFLVILILGITAAVFTHFADLFQNHQVSDVAFYFLYLLLITILLRSYTSTLGTVKGVLEDITTFMKLFIPTYMVAVGSAAGISTAGVYYPLLMVLVYLIEGGFLTVLLPAVSVFVLLTIINGIWMEEKLTLLLELLEKVICGSVKITIGIISGFSILQAMIAPVLDALQSSALKKAVSSIPGIGGMTGGMMELVMGSAVLMKNSIGLYMTLLLFLICSVPLLKITLITIVIKLSAALIGIVSDKRMTNCADRVGNGTFMLLKIVISAIALFVIQIAVIMYSTNQGIV